MSPPRAVLLVLPSLLAGCALIDQTTFAPEPETPAATQVAGAALPERRAPLVTIPYDTPDPAYEAPLAMAVRAAEAQRPGLEYDVVALVPRVPDPSAQTTLFAQGRDSAAAVMRTIIELGVPQTRIRLSGKIDPAAGVRSVLVYVR